MISLCMDFIVFHDISNLGKEHDCHSGSVSYKSESLMTWYWADHKLLHDVTDTSLDHHTMADDMGNVVPEAGGRLNKKDGLTRYGNSHVKDKTS